MKSLKEHAESIMIDLREITDDSYLVGKEEYLYSKIEGIRETLIREEVKEHKSVDPAYYKAVDCIELTCAGTSCVVNGVTVSDKKKLWRASISPLITKIGIDPISYAGNSDISSKGFSKKSFSGFLNSEGNIHTGNEIFYTRIGQELIFKNIPDSCLGRQQFLTVIALWSSVRSLCGYDEDDPFPVPSEYKLHMLVKEDLFKSWAKHQDQKDDEHEDVLQVSKGNSNGK